MKSQMTEHRADTEMTEVRTQGRDQNAVEDGWSKNREGQSQNMQTESIE